jgi:hypothetical protein
MNSLSASAALGGLRYIPEGSSAHCRRGTSGVEKQLPPSGIRWNLKGDDPAHVLSRREVFNTEFVIDKRIRLVVLVPSRILNFEVRW